MTERKMELDNIEKSKKKYLFDDPKNVKRLLGCFYASLVGIGNRLYLKGDRYLYCISEQ